MVGAFLGMLACLEFGAAAADATAPLGDGLSPIHRVGGLEIPAQVVQVSPEGRARVVDPVEVGWAKSVGWGEQEVMLARSPAAPGGEGSGGSSGPRIAVGPEVEVRHWTVSDGLPHDKVRSVLSARDGSLWVGTAAGLARFRGERIEVYTETNAPAMEATGSVVRALWEEPDGRLWLGTETGLLTYWQGVFSSIPLAREGVGLNAFASASRGGFWLAADGGVGRMEKGTLTWHEIPGLSRVMSVVETRQGGLWVGGTGGVVAYDPQSRQAGRRVLDRFDLDGRVFTNILVRGLHEDREGVLWMGSNHGIWRLAAGGHMPQRTDEGAGVGTPKPVNARFLEEGERGIWTVDDSPAGAVWLMQREGGITRQTVIHAPIEFPSALTLDRDGAVWVGSRQGLFRFARRPCRTFALGGWLGTWTPFSALAEGSDGALWFAAHRGLGRWSAQGIWLWSTGSRLDLKEAALLPGEAARALVMGSGGAWASLAADPGGSAGSDWGWRELPRTPGLDSASAVCLGRSGAAYVGGARGLFRRDPAGSWEKVEVVGDRAVRSVVEDHSGSVWVLVAGAGLGVIRDAQVTWIQEESVAGTWRGLAASRSGGIWISSERGLGWVSESRPFREVTVERVGLVEGVSAVLEDRRGDVWLNVATGLLRLQREHLGFGPEGPGASVLGTLYGRADGVRSLDAVDGSQMALEAADGRLWFVKRSGLVMVDPAVAPRDQGAPGVRLERVRADGRDVDLAAGRTDAWRAAGVDQVAFRFTAGDGPTVEPWQIEYRLEGHDRAWRDAGSGREVVYAALEPGRYRFHLRARTRHTGWGVDGGGWPLEVVRPFWRAWPFGVAVVGMGLAAAWAGMRWREHRARVRSERAGVAALTSERARIARAMHDHLGPRIATLAMEGGGTEEAHARAREALRELNEVIWAVNPEHDTLEGLADFVSNFASRYLTAARLALNLDIEPGLPAVDLPVQVRGELAAMFKEALRNAVQHARANQVLVGLRWEQEEVRLSVADDGGGFAWPMPEAVRARHVARKAVDGGLAGVLGFPARMSALGGECRIESAPGQGTRIEFRWPARRL